MSESVKHNEIEPVLAGLQRIASIAEEFSQVFLKAAESFAQSQFVSTLAKRDWRELQRRMDELPQKSKEAMGKALQRGWFFGWHESLQGLVQLIERLEDADDHLIDQVMIEYYREKLEFFTDELGIKYPHRAPAIGAAAMAHTTIPDAGYLLSVPVFIAQADGLLAEITGVYMPMTNASEHTQKRYADNQEVLDQLYPLIALKGSPFLMSPKAREQMVKVQGEFNALNRHQVLHGERSDYGTEANSLKAFSLLAFVGLHLPQFAYNEDAAGSNKSPA